MLKKSSTISLLTLLLLSVFSCNSDKKEVGDLITSGSIKSKAPTITLISATPSESSSLSIKIQGPNGGYNGGTIFKMYKGENCQGQSESKQLLSYADWVSFSTSVSAVGTGNFSATYIDLFGKESECSNTVSYTLLAPQPPTGIVLYSGSTPSENPNPKIRVDGLGTKSVEVFLNPGCTGTPFFKSGTAIFTLPPLSSGTHTIYARSKTSSGYTSDCSSVFLSYTSTQAFTLNLTVGASFMSVYDMDHADVDGDGFGDFLSASNVGTCGRLNFGEGTGNYDASTGFPCVYSGRYIKVVDVDGDGKKDVLLGSDSSKLYLYRNNSLRTFTGTLLGEFGTSSSSYRIDAFDVNADGHVDIFYRVGSTLHVLLANGDGTFQSPVNSTSGLAISDHKFADLDQNGTQELIELDSFGKLVIYHHTGSGLFAITTEITLPTSMVPFFEVADLTSDGFPELIYSTSTEAKILLNDGSGNFSTTLTTTYPDYISMAYAQVADIDGDNKSDLLIQDGSSRSLIVLRGNNDGSFLYPLLYPDAVSGSRTKFMVMDFDGNGFLDLIGQRKILQTP